MGTNNLCINTIHTQFEMFANFVKNMLMYACFPFHGVETVECSNGVTELLVGDILRLSWQSRSRNILSHTSYTICQGGKLLLLDELAQINKSYNLLTFSIMSRDPKLFG